LKSLYKKPSPQASLNNIIFIFSSFILKRKLKFIQENEPLMLVLQLQFTSF